MPNMITLEVTTNHYVAAAVSRSYFPRWFHAKAAIAPYNKEIENRSNVEKVVGVGQSRQSEPAKTTAEPQPPQLPPQHHHHHSTTATTTITTPQSQQAHIEAPRTTTDDTSRQLEPSPDNILGLSLVERANVQAKLGKYQKSMELLERAIQVQRQHVFSDGHVMVAALSQTLSRRASIQCHFGCWEEACADLTTSVRMVEAACCQQQHLEQHQQQQNGKHRVALSELLVQSGLVHLRRGHRAEGMMNLEKALAMKRAVRGSSDDYASVADLLCLMAGVHHQQHDYVAASSKYTEALAIYKAARIPNDDERVVEARRQARRRNLLGHGFFSSSSSANSRCHSHRKQSAVV